MSLQSVIDRLNADDRISSWLASPVEGVAMPVRNAPGEQYVTVAALLTSHALTLTRLSEICRRIVTAFREDDDLRVMWGLEIFLTAVGAAPMRRVLRLSIPVESLERASQLQPEDLQSSEPFGKVRCIRYERLVEA